MEIWLTSLNRELIQQAESFGILAGIYTTPYLLSKAKRNAAESLKMLLDIQPGPVAVSLIADTTEEMLEQARVLHSISGRIQMNIAAYPVGYEAMRILSNEMIPVMSSLIFSPAQALIATISGADYIVPHINRIGLVSEDPLDCLQTMINITHHHKKDTKILATSIKTTAQAIQCAELGVDAVTMPELLFQEFIKPPKDTLEALSIDQDAFFSSEGTKDFFSGS